MKGCARTHQYLVYVYRESMLRAVLTDETVQGFLRQEGYHLPAERADCTAWLTQLSRRLCCSAEFPHEIGVFLGYPLSDVVGFIENSGRNFTCCGCWKLRGPAGGTASLCTAAQVYSRVSAAVPQRYPHSPPCCGGLTRTFSFQILSFYPGAAGVHAPTGKKSSF